MDTQNNGANICTRKYGSNFIHKAMHTEDNIINIYKRQCNKHTKAM